MSDLHFNVDPDLGGQKKLYLNFEKSVTNVKVNLENLNYDSKMFNKKKLTLLISCTDIILAFFTSWLRILPADPDPESLL